MAANKNILLVIADDLGKSIGCYGDTTIRTPNLDSLAAEGTVFENAFASTASCSGSRSVIYTGLHTHQNGQYGLQHTSHHFMTFDHVETAPLLLRRCGYATGIVGKVHVGPDHVYPWEVRAESPTRDVNWVAEEADKFLRSAKEDGRPFFLTVAYMDPHRDSTRGGFGNGDEGVSAPDAAYDPASVTVPDWLNDIPEVRDELAEYYRSIGRVDRGFGLIMQALKEHDFDKDTLVIFTSDNGPPFLNSKTTLYDSGVRLPLIIRQPRGAAGIRNPNLISFVDILPTLLDWAGETKSLTTSSPRPGRSFLPILEKTTTDADWTHVFGSHTFHEVTNYYPTRFLRTSRYKYHRNVAWKLDFPFSTDLYASKSWEGIRNSASPVKIGGRSLEAYIRRSAEELYDMEQDPREVVNLADDPGHREVLLEFRDQLETWQRETKDPWLFRDGVSLLEMQGHIDAGLRVPDRFDFDVSTPAS
ncbi:alkaline phosphatase-like protein [Coniochaeta ligniaria NRRL 30616]|uniref:Alkaline phosphatase-like protein n=1 Tax=Coniochaeta ligniaria NRRL 30616 TaxID=1408157 RepID=A0A1J7JI71_9PEZI|nr:alkaline phosphatase-like protein [Coniochaeta ligniaria NRRL 30616]